MPRGSQKAERISSVEEIVQVITSLFECVKKENIEMISNIKDLREETNDLISDLKVDISTFENKVNSLNIEIDNNQYEHGDMLLSQDILFHMVHQQKIVKTLFLIYSGNT